MHATASETLVLSIFHNMIYTSFTSSCFHIHVHICVSKIVAFMCYVCIPFLLCCPIMEINSMFKHQNSGGISCYSRWNKDMIFIV